MKNKNNAWYTNLLIQTSGDLLKYKLILYNTLENVLGFLSATRNSCLISQK